MALGLQSRGLTSGGLCETLQERGAFVVVHHDHLDTNVADPLCNAPEGLSDAPRQLGAARPPRHGKSERDGEAAAPELDFVHHAELAEPAQQVGLLDRRDCGAQL
jgi:hypothetical protein